MKKEELLVATASRLEELGHVAELGKVETPWGTTEDGLVVDGVGIRCGQVRKSGNTGRWWAQHHRAWVARGVSDGLRVAHLLAARIHEGLHEDEAAQRKLEEQQATRIRRDKAIELAEAEGGRGFVYVSSHNTDELFFEMGTWGSLRIPLPTARVTRELVADLKALRDELRARVADFRKEHDLLEKENEN